MIRSVLVAGIVALLAATVPLPPPDVPAVAQAYRDGAPLVPSVEPVVYAGPVTPLVVVRGFDPPVSQFGPGHLGVDVRSTVDDMIRVAADGTVTFAGQVAGRGVVVVAHADGIRTEYEPVSPTVARGDVVRRGEVIGRLAGRHPGCSGPCLHWGARRGDVYLDPLSLLRLLGPVTLLPW